MVTLNLAYTNAINPSPSPSSSTSSQDPGPVPVLTRAQIWQGLRLKVRDAPKFVSAITSCKVIDDSENKNGTVVREIVFKESPGKTVRETCRLFEDSRVDFHQPDGSVVSNIVSDGPSGDGKDLWMTYSFSWQYSDLKESDTEQIEANMKKLRAGAKMAVDMSIEAIRRLVTDGTIKA